MEGITLVSNVGLATRAQLLRQIKAEQLYLAVSPTWEQFCEEHLPFGRKTADNLVRELDRLGEEFMMAAERLDIGQRQLRALAAAPDHLLPRAEGNEIVIGDERVPLTEKGKVLELLEDLLAEQDRLKLRIEKGEADLKKKQDAIADLRAELKGHEDALAIRISTQCEQDFLDAVVALRRAADWLSHEDAEERPAPATVLGFYRHMRDSLSEIAHYGAQYITPEWARDYDALQQHLQDVLERGSETVEQEGARVPDEWGDEDRIL